MSQAPPPDDQNDPPDAGDGDGDGEEETEEPPAQAYGLPDTVSLPDAAGRIPLPHGIGVTINEITLDAVTNLSVKGEGRQSQYLTEVTVGSGAGDDAGDGTDGDTADGGGESGDGSASSGGSGSGEISKTPPLELTIEARIGQSTMADLLTLRENQDPFPVSVGDISLDDMVLDDLQRELTGQAPDARGEYREQTYDARITVKEYRETVVQIPATSQPAQTSGGNQSSTAEDGDVPTGEDGESDTTPDEEWSDTGDDETADGDGTGDGFDETTVEDAETVDVSGGSETQIVTLDAGDTLENVVYDITAPGASIQIRATGTGWTIRNVGIRGRQSGHRHVFALAPEGGTCILDNIYLGDGGQPGSAGGGIFIRHDPAASGTLVCRRLHVAQFTNTGLSAHRPAMEGQSLHVAVNDSYFYSNNIANVRLGALPDAVPAALRNTTIAIDRTAVPPCDAACSHPGTVNPRAIWAFNGPVAVANSDIEGSITSADNGHLNWQNSRRRTNAARDPPESVPLTPEAAGGGK